MTNPTPLITLHSDDAKGRVWITCDCGWSKGEAVPSSDEEDRNIVADLMADAAAHWRDAHGDP